LKTEANYYEMVVMPLQTRIYVYDKMLKPLGARDVRVQMSLQPPGESAVRQIPFQYVVLPPTMAEQDYVVAVWDAASLGSKETPITIEFSGLPDHRRPTTSFTPLFSSDKIRPYVAQVLPMKSEADRVLRQRTCPACGDVLGNKGPVVKVLIGDYPLYLCCENCIATVRESPERYLPRPQMPAGGR